MNKKLVAVAVAAVLAAPMAQAQTANVTLYGRINLNLEYISASGNAPDISRLTSNSSRFGLRGVEALGGGLNAIWQIENGSVGIDASGGALAGRDTFIGFQGGWGTVRFGNFLAPYDDMHPIFGNSPAYLTGMMSTTALWANNGGGSKGTGSFDDRLNNSLRYDTANIAGFTGSVQVALYDDAGSGGARDAWILSAAAIYRNGPFQGGLAYEGNQDVRADGLNDWAWTATASWNFGVVRVGGLYEQIDYDTPLGGLKRDLWGVFADGPLGPGTWHLAYQQARDAKGSSATYIGGITGALADGTRDTGANQWAATYNYPLSKRTAVYFGYSRLDNDGRAAYNYSVAPYRAVSQPTGANGPVGLTYNGFALGAVHNF
jgi:predicted porin